MKKLKNLLRRIWDKICGNEYDFELPPSWPMDRCYDCGVSMTPPYWEKFVEISGKEYSVPHCDTCMEKQEEEIRKYQNRKTP